MLPLTDDERNTEKDGADAETETETDSSSAFEILGYKFKSKRRYEDVIVS